MTKNKRKASPRLALLKSGNYKKYLVFVAVVVAAGFLSYGSLSMFRGALNLNLNSNVGSYTYTYEQPRLTIDPGQLQLEEQATSSTNTAIGGSLSGTSTTGSIGVINTDVDLSTVYSVNATYSSSAQEINVQLSVGTDVKVVTYTLEKPSGTTTTKFISRPLIASSTYRFPATFDTSSATSFPSGEYEIRARVTKTNGTTVSAVADTVTIPRRVIDLDSPVVILNPSADEDTELTPINIPSVTPSISSPSDGATGVGLTPTIRWTVSPTTAITQLNSFDLYISTDSNFDNIVYEKESISKSTRSIIVPSGELNNNTKYYVKVVARNINNTDVIRLIFDSSSFTTEAAATPDPTPGDVTVNFAQSSSSVDEDDDEKNVQVTLSKALTYDVEVYYSIKLETEADFGDDFRVPSAKKVTFDAGDTTANIEVEIFDDNTREFDEDIVFKLSSFGFTTYRDNLVVGSRNEHELTIEDNDGGLSRGGVSGSRISCEKYFEDMDRYHPLCNEVAELRDKGIFMGQETSRGRIANLDAKLKRSEYFAIAARITGSSRSFVDTQYLSQFKDLNRSIINDRGNDWWLEAISSLRGIVRGYGDGTLQPTRITTEAEISKVALEAVFRDFENRDFLSPWYTDTLNFMADFGFYADPVRQADRGDAVEIIYIILKAVDDIDYYDNLWR